MSEIICNKFLESAKKSQNRTAVMLRRGSRWSEVTWEGYRELVETIAAGLQTLGVRKGDRVAIVSNTRYEWAATDLAILGLGAITVPIYQNSTPEDIAYILSDSEAKVLFCESDGLARKLKPILAQARAVEKIVLFDSEGDAGDSRALPLEDIQQRGRAALKASPTLYELAVAELDTSDLATIVYTSGTTGRPKGVMHTHLQIISEVTEAFPLLGVSHRDRSLTFLPFAHVLGRIEIWGHALLGYTMAFAESIDSLKRDLGDVKPTLIVAVPRVFEKIHNGILAQAEISPLKSRMFKWAISVGREISRHKVDKQPVPLDLALKYQAARKLVFDKITERLGGNLRFAVCGGAPLSPAIAEFFHAAGLLVLEGYGLTETIAAITVNTPFDYRFGTVGKPIGDVRLKIAEDGEILVQSKKVMKGYYKLPDDTAQAISNDWLHTGDIGEISPEGYLRITDRKKDLIKTAGGKYVAPQRLEGLLKANRFVSQVHIHGDQKKFVVALITLNPEAVKSFAEEVGIPASERAPAALAANPKIKEQIRRAVADANSHLATFESIKNFAILPNEFSIEAGEMTPSLKIKRKIVDERYRDILDKLHGGSDAAKA